MLYLNHTDEVREWAYDRNSSVGRLYKGLDEATKSGWTVIDMKNDWKLFYPFETKTSIKEGALLKHPLLILLAI